MMFSALLVFLPAVISGGLLVHLLWSERGPRALLLKFSLGIGLGLGINSILYFAQLLVAPLQKWILLPQLVLLFILALLVFLRRECIAWTQLALPRFSLVQWALLAAFLAGSILFAWTFSSRVQARPQGDYDAWTIWNRAARFIARDPANWQATLSPELYWQTHPDYPLLVPLNVAWGWQVLGTETQRIPILQAILFMAASVGSLFASIYFKRSIGLASLAALILVGTPAFTNTSASLISDIPVMFFILACGILTFMGAEQQNRGLLYLAGIMCGLAGWTKNEGLLLILVAPAALLITQRSRAWRKLPGFAGGLLFPLVVIIYFKSLTPGTDLFADTPAEILARVIDPWRYGVILKALWKQLLHFGGGVAPILLLMILYALLMRRKDIHASSGSIWTITLILILQFVGYCAIYVMTPHNLTWHVATSMMRLVLHIFPLGIFLMACLTIQPEDLFSTPDSPEPIKEIASTSHS